jgi:hypothetical protein
LLHMRQKVVMGISSLRSQSAQFMSNGLSRETQIATPVPIIATTGFICVYLRFSFLHRRLAKKGQVPCALDAGCPG